MANFQTKRYFTTLDGLRGIAALIVVLSHLGETFDLPRCVAHAHLAVEFFFLLSGFILAYAYDNRWTNMSIWSFFRRRLVRLHPLVPLCVLLGIVPLVLISPDGLPGGSPLNFALLAVGCALMIPAFPIQSMNPFNGPVWTLFYEYLANILYALVLRRLGKKALLALIAVAAAETTLVALRIDLFGLLLRYGYTFKAGWCFKPAHFYVATTRLAFPLLAGLLICRAGLRIRVRHAFWPCAAAFAAILLVPVLGGENLWRGPVSSEGGCQYLYAGLVDQNYAQDQGYRFAELPWIVDFELRRVHPLCTNFGLIQVWNQYKYLGTRAANDARIAATLAFGHSAHFDKEGAALFQTYFMTQALAARYTITDAVDIRYADAEGNLKDLSAAIADGSVRRSQPVTRYADGTVVAANGSTNETMRVTVGGETYVLPPLGYAAVADEGRIRVVSGDINDGRRADLSISPEYAYVDGRGTRFASPVGTCDGQFVRHFCDDGSEEVVPGFGATEIVLPFAAKSVEALDEARQRVADGGFAIEKDRTVLRVRKDIVSWKLIR